MFKKMKLNNLIIISFSNIENLKKQFSFAELEEKESLIIKKLVYPSYEKCIKLVIFLTS